jgi:hypothetical protein
MNLTENQIVFEKHGSGLLTGNYRWVICAANYSLARLEIGAGEIVGIKK